MTIKNKGTTDSGPFKWAWFSTYPSDTPALIGEIANLGPGDSQVVKGDFYFGLQHVYKTLAVVNFDHSAPDNNFFDGKFVPLDVTTSDKPLMVDFSQSANGTPILSDQPIKSNDFSAWDFQVSPGPASDPNCKDASVIVKANPNFNELVTGKDSQSNTCSNLPIIFTFDQPIGSATVTFSASTPGDYTLELQDDAGNKIQATTIAATNANQSLTARVPTTSTASNGRKVIFSGPPNGSAAILSVSFGLPSQLPQG